MAEILLTHSFLLRFDPKQFKLGQPYPPLGTLYAASVLKRHGMEPAFHDMMFASGPEDLYDPLKKHRPRLVVIYDDGFNYLTKMCLSNMRQAALQMITLSKRSGAMVAVYSSDSADNHALYLNHGADFVILGEGELTLAELCGRILSGHNEEYAEIRGIAWKSKDGIRLNPPRPLITDLDEIPFPAWELLDMARYRQTWKKRNGYFMLNMVTTRGCPYKCVWCAKPIYGNHYNSRTPQNVVDEMLLLKRNHAPDGVWFADDIFGLKPGWIDEFEQLVRANGLSIPFTIQTRVDLLLEEKQVTPLAGAGCKKVWLGIESGSQRILDEMKKGTTVAQAYEVSPRLREAGIGQAFFLQLGFPSETKEDIRKTIRLLTDLLPDDIGISVTYPLPGTPFYDSVSADLGKKTHWNDSNDLALMFNGRFSPAWYRYQHRYIHKYYRFRQGLSYLKDPVSLLSGTGPSRLRRIVLVPYYLGFAILFRVILHTLEYAGRRSI